MINPTECAARIIENNPELAEPLLDLLLWANKPNLANDEDYDDLLESLYAMTPDSIEARKAYISARIAGAVISIVPFALLAF